MATPETPKSDTPDVSGAYEVPAPAQPPVDNRPTMLAPHEIAKRQELHARRMALSADIVDGELIKRQGQRKVDQGQRKIDQGIEALEDLALEERQHADDLGRRYGTAFIGLDGRITYPG